MIKTWTLIVLSIFTWLQLSCSPETNNKKNTPPQNSQKTTTEALKLFQATQAFSSILRKTTFHKNQFYSLVFSKAKADLDFTSTLIAHTIDGQMISVPQLPKQWTTIDFAFNENGDLIELA